MRSFINWDILQRIENSPKDFIVQRDVSLLEAFIMGYEDILLRLGNKDQLEEKYKDVPSINEYVLKKYNADNIGTRNCMSVIQFTCEDEREFFYKYFEFLKEYEQKYPIQETLSYIVSETAVIQAPTQSEHDYYKIPQKPNILKSWLTAIKNRPGMYFGYNDISCLRAFLDGYFLCKRDYNIPLTMFDTKVREFTDSIICETINLPGEFVTWDRLYRYDRNWTAWGRIEESVAKNILEDFWKDLEKYTGETLV